MMSNIEIHTLAKEGLIPLLTKPLHLFAELYKLLDPQFGVLSNSLYTDEHARERFGDLSDFFLQRFGKVYASKSNRRLLEGVKQVLINSDDNNVLCLSLFKGLADYLVLYKKGTLKLLTPVKIEGYVITAKPPNPIYDAGAAPVREYYGTGFHDLTDIFKYISIIKETNLHIHLIKNDKLKKTGTYLKYRLKKGLKVAVTPFKGDITFEFDSRLKKWPGNEKTPYWFKKIENIEAAKTWLIEKVLQPCVEKEVDILVLPELTVDEKLIVFFKDWLKTNNRERVSSGNGGLLLVAAGTFHFLGQDKKRLNVATVLNHAGEVVWMQNKIKRFSLDASDIKKKPDLKELLKISSAGGCECIDETDTICCADTPVGRISVCICIDFFHREHLEAYRQSGINIFLVPAMTPRNIRFLKTAGLLAGNNLAAAFVSNSGYAAKKENSSIHKDGASFYFLPRKGERGVFAVGEDSDLLIFDMKS